MTFAITMRRLAAFSVAGIACLALLALATCRPQRYNVVPKGMLHRHMWRIQASVEELDTLMKGKPEKGKVVAVLARIEVAAREVTKRKIKSQHTLLSGNAESFHKSVLRALKSAAADPPNYYPAGKISGACIHCHDPDGGLLTN